MTPREKKIAYMTAAVLGGAALFTQVVEPGIKRYQDLSERRDLLDGVLERERALSERVAVLVKRRKTLQTTLAPSEGASLAPWLMGHVREVAQEAGFKPRSLRFVNAQPLEQGKKGPFVELRFELRARTSAKKLQDFLVRLTASDRHVRVRSLASVPNNKGKIEATIQLLALAPRDALKGLGAEAE